ncbi:hypothetical protein K525DRAFT_286742 [Schizophyllum commune Loenen D]|nr:hypothetical protein K525DRAFT_286742 [Schizophyllum commune Loenen D]
MLLLFLYTGLAAVILWRTLWLVGRYIRDRALRQETCLQEFEQLGLPRRGRKVEGTAVICGGSYSGLLAARVCHDHFERVVIIEAEEWLSTEEGRLAAAWTQTSQRSRIMQYFSLNATQVSTFVGLQRLYDNFVAESRVSDIHIGPAMLKADFWGNVMKLNPDNLPDNTHASRQAQETLLRRLTLDKKRFPNIQHIAGLVVGVRRHAYGRSSVEGVANVQSVSVRVGKDIVSVPGALFVDCTGSSHGLKWFARAGYGQALPRRTLPLNELTVTYDPKARFSALTFPLSAALRARLDDFLPPRTSATIYACLANSEKQNTSVYAVERDGGMVMLCAGAWGDIELPTTLDEFIAFTKSRWMERPYPAFYLRLLDELRVAETGMTCCKCNTGPRSYTQYHKAGDLPSNWIAIGDSVMTLNPIFGQGLTKVIAGAACLDNALRKLDKNVNFNEVEKEVSLPTALPHDFATKFFAAQATKIEHMWESTKIADYGFENTTPMEGETRSIGRLSRWYEKRLKYLSTEDGDIAMAVFRVSQSLAPAIDLIHPCILFKILWSTLRNPHL